ncbi:tripartite ATP-independent transporter DctP family solute receptor [Caldalkalibacillus uzonensis]|uniref:Tripartite ATP-independent transporter DctP family solute receptor n=1 Tax=Caldalkalibacillus uzonensis TaxID=353224 RepID=A0ABU0CQB3_9BACI|nr:TRAP transporter substrate-binding protein [Caldalkalibacillus uzonensis]MDQ0338283.1 tripartite ATP-independent transporter DctP family solute receptor [Caldalkalibacillus uzonensis]
MTKKKWLLLLLSLTMVISVLAACGSSEDTGGTGSDGDASQGEESGNGDAMVLRISLGINNHHPLYESALHFKELLEEKTDDFVVEVYHSAQIGDDRVATEMLQMGDLAITIPSTSPLVNFVPEYGVFDLPFMIPSEEVADAVLDGPFGDKMLALLEEQDLIGLAWYENGFRNLTNSVRPVEKVEDLKGLVIRTMENQIHLDAWSELGANPTPMSFAELFTAMQQGTVDGQENPYPTIELEGYPEVQDYISDTNHVYTPFVFLFSKPIWDTLSPEQQELIRETALEARLFNRERTREVAEQSKEKLKELMTFTEISDEERARFREAVMPVIDKHADNISRDIVEEFMAEIEKHS